MARQKQSAQISRSPAAVREYLVDYVSEVFPAVFSNKPFFTRVVGEVKRHHRYLQLFTAPKGEAGDKTRIMTGVHLLSLQTMLMFLLAWLYDIESPANDGSCDNLDSKSECLSRKQVMDTTQPLCQWVQDPDNGDDSHMCEFANPAFNVKVMIYIAVIVALVVSLCSKPIDMIFDLLSAPTADSLKVSIQDTALKRLGRRVSHVARRMSAVASSSLSSMTQRKGSGGGKGRDTIVGVATRKIPSSTEQAHALATASMKLLADASRQTLHQNQLRRLQVFHGANSARYAAYESDSDDDDNDDASGKGEVAARGGRDNGSSASPLSPPPPLLLPATVSLVRSLMLQMQFLWVEEVRLVLPSTRDKRNILTLSILQLKPPRKKCHGWD